MSERFYNPYQFIPVKACRAEHQVSFKNIQDLKQSSDFIRHDYWHKSDQGGWSGKVACVLETRSPLVVGGQQRAGDKDKKQEGRVECYLDREGRVAIPGNSLRGMISSLCEAISDSSLRVLNDMEDGFYSTRMQTSEAFKDMGLLCQRGQNWYIFPLEMQPSEGRYDDENDRRFLESHQCFQYHHNNDRHIRGVLYIRGKHASMPKKLRETYLPWDGKIVEKDLIAVEEGVVSSLEWMLRDSRERDPDSDFPYLPKGYEAHEGRSWDKGHSLLLDGDLIYYKSSFRLRERKTIVTELSYSAIGRRVIEGHLASAFKRMASGSVLPWGSDGRDTLTPAEALFGVVEDKPVEIARNLASRVRFSDASLVSKEGADLVLMPEKTLKILNSPKPPSPSMYFSNPRKSSYISKGNLNLDIHDPNGRKRYLPHPEAIGAEEDAVYHFETDTARRDYKPHLHLKCQPVRPGVRFEFDVHFENLSSMELELLYRSIFPAAGFVHRLGLGKPLGLGHIEIIDANLSVADRSERYTVSSLLGDKKLYQTVDIDQILPKDNESLIDPETLNAVSTLSDPANIHHPVCYPYSKFAKQAVHNESEGFEWFVCNDRAAAYSGQFLRSMNTKNGEGEMEIVPTLDADIFCPKETQGSADKGKGDKPRQSKRH